jgi:TRAP-type uncharacterized transport system fused permease subunit
MITSLTLGMGLPCTPAYIIAITIGGPALLAMNCELLASHMFVYYFAILAGVTPPVCIAAYCGAAIAGAKPLETGFESLKLALVAFIVPYVFVYNEALLMQGNVIGILTVCCLLLICVILSAGGLSGFLFKKMGNLGRIITICLAMVAAFLCSFREMTHQPMMLLAAFGVFAGLSFMLYRGKKQVQLAEVQT